jgi:hypothetical protein
VNHTIPALDPNHPINDGCVFAWDARLPQRDLRYGLQGTLNTNVTRKTYKAGLNGCKFAGGSSNASCVTFNGAKVTAALHAGPMSVFGYFDLASRYEYSLLSQDAGDYRTGWLWSWRTSYFNNGAANTQTSVDCNGNYPQTGLNTFCGLFSGIASGAGSRMVVNNVEIAVAITAGTSTAVADTASRLIVGSSAAFNESATSTALVVRAFARTLTNSEIAALHRNPVLGYKSVTDIRKVWSFGNASEPAAPYVGSPQTAKALGKIL